MVGRGEATSMTPGKRAKRLLLLIVLLLLVVAGYYGLVLARFVSGVSEGATPGIWPSGDVRVLVLGVDNRGQDPHPRSDTMLLLGIPQGTGGVTVGSILRDTWVSIPGVGQEKINAAYAAGGPDLARKTAETWLGLDIPYYAVTDFEGFIHIVDALGGVDIDVEKPMDYVDDGRYDIHLKPGLQHLNGAQALGYVRFRHDALGDYARTERQRKFVQAVIRQMMRPQNLVRFPNVLAAAEPYIRTNLSPGDQLRLGLCLWRDRGQSITQIQLPPADAFREAWSSDGQSILVPDTPAVRQYVQKYFPGNTLGSGGFGGSQSPASSAPVTEPALTGRVSGEWVNFRAGPGTDYPTLGRLVHGTGFEVLDRQPGWLHIRLGDGREGYVSAAFVQLDNTP
ncbi:LCP family protein [Kyrpidia spormannii]|nr:LCP family protein [Kyrpidia spormannii]